MILSYWKIFISTRTLRVKVKWWAAKVCMSKYVCLSMAGVSFCQSFCPPCLRVEMWADSYCVRSAANVWTYLPANRFQSSTEECGNPQRAVTHIAKLSTCLSQMSTCIRILFQQTAFRNIKNIFLTLCGFLINIDQSQSSLWKYNFLQSISSCRLVLFYTKKRIMFVKSE